VRSNAATGFIPVSQGLSHNLFNAIRARSRLKTVATLLVLLTCTLQGFIAQTHVHADRAQPSSLSHYIGDAGNALAAAPSADDDDSSNHNRRDGSSSSCILCQIVLHGGAAPVPAFALSLPAPVTISVAAPEQTPPASLVAVSFSWQGLAPPLT